MTWSNDLIVRSPVYIPDGLCVLFKILDQLPWIDICECVYMKQMDCMVLFGGHDAVVSLEREGESWDVIALQ